jgi:hypothetical protein
MHWVDRLRSVGSPELGWEGWLPDPVERVVWRVGEQPDEICVGLHCDRGATRRRKVGVRSFRSATCEAMESRLEHCTVRCGCHLELVFATSIT